MFHMPRSRRRGHWVPSRWGAGLGEPARALLRVYLLGSLEFDSALQLQRSLAYQLSEQDHDAALILCEHPPLITVGRHGSPAHIQLSLEELAARRWSVRWVHRGGGTFLHLPG